LTFFGPLYRNCQICLYADGKIDAAKNCQQKNNEDFQLVFLHALCLVGKKGNKPVTFFAHLSVYASRRYSYYRVLCSALALLETHVQFFEFDEQVTYVQGQAL